jgi:hypothetical protein
MTDDQERDQEKKETETTKRNPIEKRKHETKDGFEA